MKIAMPPRRGMAVVCTFRASGTSTSPLSSAQSRRNGTMIKAAKSAVIKITRS